MDNKTIGIMIVIVLTAIVAVGLSYSGDYGVDDDASNVEQEDTSMGSDDVILDTTDGNSSASITFKSTNGDTVTLNGVNLATEGVYYLYSDISGINVKVDGIAVSLPYSIVSEGKTHSITATTTGYNDYSQNVETVKGLIKEGKIVLSKVVVTTPVQDEDEEDEEDVDEEDEEEDVEDDEQSSVDDEEDVEDEAIVKAPSGYIPVNIKTSVRITGIDGNSYIIKYSSTPIVMESKSTSKLWRDGAYQTTLSSAIKSDGTLEKPIYAKAGTSILVTKASTTKTVSYSNVFIVPTGKTSYTYQMYVLPIDVKIQLAGTLLVGSTEKQLVPYINRFRFDQNLYSGTFAKASLSLAKVSLSDNDFIAVVYYKTNTMTSWKKAGSIVNPTMGNIYNIGEIDYKFGASPKTSGQTLELIVLYTNAGQPMGEKYLVNIFTYPDGSIKSESKATSISYSDAYYTVFPK